MIVVILTYPRSGSTLLLEIIDKCTRLECLSEIFRFKSGKSINTGENKYRPKVYYESIRPNDMCPSEYLKVVYNSDDICFKIMYFQLIFRPRVFVWLIKNTDLWIINKRHYTSDALISMIIKKNYKNKIFITLYIVIKTIFYKLSHKIAVVFFKIFKIRFCQTIYENYCKENYFVKDKLSNYIDKDIFHSGKIIYDFNVKKSHFGNREKFVSLNPYIKYLRSIIK